MNEEKLRKYIRRMLTEQGEESSSSEKPKSKKRKSKKASGPTITASPGRGRFETGVNDAGALGKDNPKQLMKNLKITSGGSGDLQGVANILAQAFKGAEAMQKAYGDHREISKGDKKGLQVSVDKIDARNGMKYIQHTLVAAQKVGLFRLKDPVQIDIDTGNIVIYFSNDKGSWNK